MTVPVGAVAPFGALSVTVAVQDAACPMATGPGVHSTIVLVECGPGCSGSGMMFSMGEKSIVTANSRLPSGVSATPSFWSGKLPKPMVFSGVLLPGANMKISLVVLPSAW